VPQQHQVLKSYSKSRFYFSRAVIAHDVDFREADLIRTYFKLTDFE
jgi:hypothetical protein